MTLTPTRRRFTVHDYEQMGLAGVLTEDDRVELIDGEIMQMSPIGSRHVAAVARLTRRFVQRFGDVALVFVQNPIRLGEHDEPEPDLALVKDRPDCYADALPTPPDIFLVSRWPIRPWSMTVERSCRYTPATASSRCGSWTSLRTLFWFPAIPARAVTAPRGWWGAATRSPHSPSPSGRWTASTCSARDDAPRNARALARDEHVLAGAG